MIYAQVIQITYTIPAAEEEYIDHEVSLARLWQFNE